MASKQDNYLRMHHPSIYKKMKKGGKVESYKKGGKVSEGQAKADALFKHVGVPGFKGGGIAGLFEKGRVLLQDFRHRAGERKAKKKALREQENGVTMEREGLSITGIVPPKEKGLKPAIVPSNPPLFPHYGAEDRSSLENLVTDSVYGAGESVKRYVGGGLVDKKDALMAYYGVGKVEKEKKRKKHMRKLKPIRK